MRLIKKVIIRIIVRISRAIKNIYYTIINTVWRSDTDVENCFITCSGKCDGIGAQVQAILSTMLVAQEFQLIYVHTPFKKIAHRPVEKTILNKLDENWETKWEHFFNLGEGEITIDDIKVSPLNITHITNTKQCRKRSNRLYVIPHSHDFADAYPNRYLSITDRFIKKYKVSSKKTWKSFYETGKINIAVHIRRGNIDQRSYKRYTDNLYYKFLLHSLLSIFDDLNTNVSIHLYSQGSILDFYELKELDINYHLNECVFTTFYNLTSADILIMSKSSFSYSAALLSESIKLYEPFWHKPLDSWIITDWDDKNKKVIFNKSSLKKRVRSILT